GAAVELALERSCIAHEGAFHAGAPIEGAPLLEAQRGEDGNEAHVRQRDSAGITSTAGIPYKIYGFHGLSSSRSRYCSSASGLASASGVPTSRPSPVVRPATPTRFARL